MFPINVTVGAVKLGLTALQNQPKETGQASFGVWCSCHLVHHQGHQFVMGYSTGTQNCAVVTAAVSTTPHSYVQTCAKWQKFPAKEHCWYVRVWLLSLALGTPPGSQWCTDDTSALATCGHYYLSGTAKPTAWRETLEFHAAPMKEEIPRHFLFIYPSQLPRITEHLRVGRLSAQSRELEQAAQGHIQSGL